MRGSTPSSGFAHAVFSMAADALTAEAIRALGEAGVRSILLKGASLARWLYGDDLRLYVDSDLLVAAEDVGRAESVLSELGFEHPPLDDLPHDRPWHAHFWLRQGSPVGIDLHRTLIGVSVPPGALWSLLSRETEVMRVAGLDVEVLNPPARALHVALHAAADGRRLGKPLEDLSRALERVSDETWQKAAVLASRLEALPAFAVGLRLLPQGEALAERLALPTYQTAELALRASAAPRISLGFEWLARTPGIRAKLALLAHKLAPPPAFMRAWSPLPRRFGPLGLAAAYIWRPILLLGHAGRGLRAWRRATKQVSEGKGTTGRR